MNHRLAVGVLIAVAVLGLASCTNSTAGNGTAATTADSTPPTDSSSTGTGSPLASLQPCDLLSAADISQNQLTQTDSGTGSGARTCGWQNSTVDNGNGYAVHVSIRDSQGLNDINTDGYTISDDPIGSHPGKQALQTNGAGCFVAIGVSSTSRVDVTSTGSNGASESCQFAKVG